MSAKEIIAQLFGIIGLVVIASSFQCKKNKNFFLMQSIGSLAFVVNFFMIGAYAGAMSNIVNIIRGMFFSKEDKKPWKLAILLVLYTACNAFSLYLIWGDWFKMFISVLPFIGLVPMTVLMWMADGKRIRYFQVAFMSPAWIVHNIFNFSLGGILCELFSMISTIISFIRYGKDGFEKAQKYVI